MALKNPSTLRGSFAIAVLFKVHPNVRDRFREAILENASLSLANEEGCTLFDVCEGRPSQEFFLYEVYSSEDAFKAHLETPHFKQFDQISAAWVVEKQVFAYARLA